MIYNLSFFSDIGFSIKQALRTFSCKIATILYDWIIDLYNVFMYTARAEILSNEFIQKIYNKVGMILGIFMVFKLAFSLIQALVDPSKLTDGKNGFASIIKRSVIAIVLLGITPSLFRTAFQFQNLIAGAENNTDNLIYKLIVGDAPSHSADSFGRIIASKLYFGFYKENEPYKLDNGIEIEYPDSGGSTVKVDNYENLVDNVTNGTKQFSDTVDYLSITSSGHYVIDWNGLFAIGMAIAMIWILVTYCIQVATRVIQLAYLQLVAPVPILSYISDPEGAFKNWTKQCLTTYLDLFIRLAIIYFIITVSTQILEAWDDTESILYQSTTISPQDTSTMFWVVIFLIIGLLMFGKRVPELLKDLFPNFGGGAASLGFSPKLPKEVSGFAKGAATFGLGAAVGGVAGMTSGIKNGYGVRGKIAGAFGGFNRGIAGGAKTKGNIFKNVQGGMSSTRQARQRALDKLMYKIDNSDLNKEYQDNMEIITAEKAIKDEAQSQLLKVGGKYADNRLIGMNNRINYLKQHIGENDENGNKITQSRIFTQEAAYKGLLDKETQNLVDTHGKDITTISENMQKMQNKSGKAIRTFSDVDSTASAAKTKNTTIVRDITSKQYQKQKMQDKKSKIK